MNRSRARQLRMFAAWICLAAALLIWSPAWAAAWHTSRMACCDEKICPIHGAAEENRAVPAKSEESATECNHDASGGKPAGMIECSISCCRDSNPSLVTAIVFVLPAPAALSQPALTLAKPPMAATAEPVSLLDPPSPPPRAAILPV